MTTNEDSNKLIIYKGKPEEYAFIPLDISENTYYNFTNSIIYNDGSTYIKNITSGTELYNFIKDKIIDTSAIRNPDTISITNGTYNINGYLSNNMLTHIIKLYYIENFKYTLDVSQYVTGDDEHISTVSRGDTYMFTITPKLTQKDIDNIDIREATQIQPEPGGGESGGGSGSGETEDPNKKYNIEFSVDGNQKLSLTRIGTTNNYKLRGTIIIKYKQSDNSIKGDVGTISTITNNNINYTFLIYLNADTKPCVIQKIDGYNTTSKLWEGEININLDEMESPITYILRPGSTISCEVHMKISKDAPIFSKHGSRLNSYVALNSYGLDNLGLYKFKVNNNISVPTEGTAKAYFLQSLIGQYGTWDQTALNVMKINNKFGSKNSGIFIIVSDGKYLNFGNISSRTTTNIPTYLTGDFKVTSTGHNSIFTSPLNNNNTTVVLDGPPIFLYDESNKQTKIDKTIGYETDNNIFDGSYFSHKSGNKFPVPASTSRKKNVINLNNYKYLMYEQSSSKLTHYCGTQLTNADLSAYEGKTFNVVYEVWTYKINLGFQPSINTPIKNKDGEYILTDVSPSYKLNQKIDRIDWETGGGGGTTTKPVNTTYTATVTQYKLYSFKLSKTDSTTGVYEYTFED